MSLVTANSLLEDFNRELGTEFSPSEQVLTNIDEFINAGNAEKLFDAEYRRSALVFHINNKFRFNSGELKSFFSKAAAYKITFNYHEKEEIQQCLDWSNQDRLAKYLNSLGKEFLTTELIKKLLEDCHPITAETTYTFLKKELVSPTLARKDSKPKDWSFEILSSLFSAYVYESFPECRWHDWNDPLSISGEYQGDYWKHLHRNLPHLFNRNNSLSLIRLGYLDFKTSSDYIIFRNSICGEIASLYEAQSNHAYLGILIEPFKVCEIPYTWQFVADLTLYAEKHVETEVDRYYFKWREIENVTSKYIPKIDIDSANFHSLNSGYLYLDCFVLGKGDDQRLLLLFQKNKADETLIPCPRCRSHNVQGNSYSSLGVKAWECSNPLCPDRSKFNRGKRYSFHQLLRHESLLYRENLISSESVRSWMKDVQSSRTDNEVLEMLVRHYSLIEDTICLYNWVETFSNYLGRNVSNHSLPKSRFCLGSADVLDPEKFFNSSYFQRFVVERDYVQTKIEKRQIVGGVLALQGDSFEVLHEIESNTIDGAVTSPPYYNAREYSQWDNIYTYLYDMYNINKEVFRCLKPGALYFYNIFDYFDNERNVATSAMGEKRMILGAYTVDLFKRIGFQCVGNIVWDKGDIEGKRGFNGGNFSPFYQSPFNCWEHIYIFEKPGSKTTISYEKLLNYVRLKPVMKMVRGENTHGHTAPFPEMIPELLFDNLPPGATVLDPFGGSMTTGRVANSRNSKAVCIEMDPEYFDLGVKKLIEAQGSQLF